MEGVLIYSLRLDVILNLVCLSVRLTWYSNFTYSIVVIESSTRYVKNERLYTCELFTPTIVVDTSANL
jgi:hypothetical protein